MKSSAPILVVHVGIYEKKRVKEQNFQSLKRPLCKSIQSGERKGQKKLGAENKQKEGSVWYIKLPLPMIHLL